MKKILRPKRRVANIESIEELASVLRFDESYLSEIIKNAKYSYRKVNLKKKDGGTREINAPQDNLKGVQNSILYNYLNKVKLPNCVFGCGPGKSIIENAVMHTREQFMINFDIKDFFPSVHFRKILQIYIDLGCSDLVASALCKLTTLDYCLPQGSRTSPYLSALVLENLDRRINLLARANRVTYTRYFDDITLSGKKVLLKLQDNIENIIKTEGYKVKQNKKFIYKPGEDKKITGLIIKKDGSLDIEGKEKIMDYLKKIISSGFSELESSVVEKERQSLQGKIAFIKSVDPKYAGLLKEIFDLIEWP